MRTSLRNLTVAVLIVLFAVPATPQQANGLSFGVAALAARTPYNETTKTRLVPSLRYQKQNLTIGVSEGVQYKFFRAISSTRILPLNLGCPLILMRMHFWPECNVNNR